MCTADVLANGTTMYNHIGMQLHGRELTLYAQFYRYTGDKKGLILKHFDKIMGRAYMLLARRRAAQQLPKAAQDYGMLRGDANEDLGATEITCGTTYPDGKGGPHGDCQTELPYISITPEAWRGFRELGPVLVEIGTAANRPDVVGAGKLLSAEAAPMLADFTASLQKSRRVIDGLPCHPASLNWDSDRNCPTGGEVFGHSFQPYKGRTDFK